MQVTYFPHLNMGRVEEVNFRQLNLKLWNYGIKADKYVKGAQARAALDAVMATNVSNRQTIGDMGIVSIGDFDLRYFGEKERLLCREARLLLFIGSLSYSGVLNRGANTGHYMATTENFTLVEQNFQQDREHIAVRDGYIVSRLVGGYKISEVKFQRPEYTLTPLEFTGDERVLQNLLELRKSQKRLYRRLMRAVDMFMQAYCNDTKLSEQSRILLMASSYEILFDLPDKDQRKSLKNIFRQRFVQTDDIKRRYSSKRSNGFAWEIDSIKVMWVDKFYTLRNKIIHGLPIAPDDYIFCKKQRHFDIATLFFVLGLKAMIGETRQISQTSDRIMWKEHEDLNSKETYEGFMYKKSDSWPEVLQLRQA